MDMDNYDIDQNIIAHCNAPQACRALLYHCRGVDMSLPLKSVRVLAVPRRILTVDMKSVPRNTGGKLPANESPLYACSMREVLHVYPSTIGRVSCHVSYCNLRSTCPVSY